MSPTYEVEVIRDGKWWVISSPELRALTQARRIDEVSVMTRELIALETGVALADVAIEQRVELVAGGEKLAAKVRALRDRRARLSEEETHVQADM